MLFQVLEERRRANAGGSLKPDTILKKVNYYSLPISLFAEFTNYKAFTPHSPYVTVHTRA